MSNAKLNKEAQITDIFSQLREDGSEFFLNSQLSPTVKVPDDGFQQEWPADSQRIQDLVISLYYEMTDERITSSERDFVMALLREECRKGGRRHTAVEVEETDRDVIVQAVLYFMNINEFFKGRTIDLLKTLRDIQKSEQIVLAEDIPVFTNIFSRRLRRLVPVLKGYGISIRLEHKEEGSYCTVQRLDSFQREPSADDVSIESSGATTKQGKSLPLTDDSDGENRIDPPMAKKKATTSNQKGGAK